MKHIRIFLVALASITVAAVGGWYLVGWIVGGAFESAAQQGGFQQLSNVLEAAVGSTLARSDSRLQTGTVSNAPGAINYYRNNPQHLQRDRRYFQTWASALAIAGVALRSRAQATGWESSTQVARVPLAERTDSWGHAFCVQSNQQRAIVVSAGPQALGSLDCGTLKVSENDVSGMPGGRLIPHDSGALILVARKPQGTAGGVTGGPAT